jgi:hypothetical protein
VRRPCRRPGCAGGAQTSVPTECGGHAAALGVRAAHRQKSPCYRNRLEGAGVLFPVRKLFALVALVALSAAADEFSFRTLQSGSISGPTPLTDHGLHGEGQIIAILDTGVDWDNCFFAEADGSPPPMNTGTPEGGFQSRNVDRSRRKIIAYDFLYSCNQFPNARGCDDPSSPLAFDNQGHGTTAAGVAAGDQMTPVFHDFADSIASAAKLVVQDAGFIRPDDSTGFPGGDNCSQRPGLGCPLIDLHPVLQQAYDQGARIHSNSWGDRQNTPLSGIPPTGNYPKSARDIDDFVWTHPDMVVVFNTGNAGQAGQTSLSAPGDAKNAIQVGGTRTFPQTGINFLDDTSSWFSGRGPTHDGRLKPDLVGPAAVVAAADNDISDIGTCYWQQPGTSWSSPTVAAAAALVRQYYSDGYYPTGAPLATDQRTPSAALVKATLIAAARPVTYSSTNDMTRVPAAPAPNYEEGFGFPVLGDVLHLPGDRAVLSVRDVPLSNGLTEGEAFVSRIAVRAGTPLRIALVWTDPPGSLHTSVDDATPVLVNDLDLEVVDPSGRVLFGNDPLHPGKPDRLNNVEALTFDSPASGNWTISVTAAHLGQGLRQSYALVVDGDLGPAPSRSRIARH